MGLEKRVQDSVGDAFAYRIMKLSRWLRLVDDEEFSFTNPSGFMDVFENFSHSVFPHHSSGSKAGSMIRQESEGTMFVSCWTDLERSSAMWQVYGKIDECEPVDAEDAYVQLGVPVHSVVKGLGAIDGVGDATLSVGHVQYLAAEELKQHGANLADAKRSRLSQDRELHMMKRVDFEWEREIRFLLDPDRSDSAMRYMSLRLRWQDVVTGIVLDPRLVGEHAVIRDIEIRGFTCPIEKSSLCERTLLVVPVQG